MTQGQQESQSNQNESNQRMSGMMDMSQMQNMQAFGYPSSANPMMNFQNLTPEQQMQMMQFRSMQGGQMPPNNMYPGNSK